LRFLIERHPRCDLMPNLGSADFQHLPPSIENQKSPIQNLLILPFLRGLFTLA